MKKRKKQIRVSKPKQIRVSVPKPPKPVGPPVLTKRKATEKFNIALETLGLPVASKPTALVLGLSVRHVQRIAGGEEAPVPETVALLLAMYLKHGLGKTAAYRGYDIIEVANIIDVANSYIVRLDGQVLCWQPSKDEARTWVDWQRDVEARSAAAA